MPRYSIMIWYQFLLGANQWLVTMNESKTKSVFFFFFRVKKLNPFTHPPSPLIINNVVIEDVAVHKHLGVTLSINLSWRAHVLQIHQKASTKLNLLKPMKYKLSWYTLEVLCIVRGYP